MRRVFGHYEVVGEAANGQEVDELANKLQPEVVVLAISMPVLNGLDAARQTLKARPETQALALAEQESEVIFWDAIKVGVRAYVLKSDPGHDIVRAIEALGLRQPYLTPKTIEIVFGELRAQIGHTRESGPSRECLTPRERQIMQLLADGKSNKNIAFSLGISIKTAIARRINLMRKLGLESISALARYAIRNKIIEL